MTEQSLADVMAKLAEAEAEAAKLRDELKKSVAVDDGSAASIDELARRTPAKPASRIDGKGGRETLFGAPKGGGDGWLRDGMEFLVREQPSESAEIATMNAEDEAKVQRRLFIGLAATAAFGVLSQISDTAPPPSKPLFFYIVPLVRARALLSRAERQATNGYWDDLSATLRQVIGSPNDVRENMFKAAAYLDAKEEDQARRVALDLMETLEKIDYNKYFDNLGPVSGAKAAEYSKFSTRAAKAAGDAMDNFLKLMDAEAVEAARAQVAASSALMEDNDVDPQEFGEEEEVSREVSIATPMDATASPAETALASLQ